MGELNQDISKDLSVGRHLRVGGRANVQGEMRVGRNLRVEGRLEARGLKAASKGLFGNVEALQAAYPQPEDGWWALVGNSFPAQIWRASGGDWGQEPVGELGSEDLEIDLEGLLQEIGDEAQDRQDADAALGRRIDSTIEALQTANTLSIQRDNTEAAAREAGDAAEAAARRQAIDTAVGVETSARSAAITGEATARSQADAALGSRIDTEATEREAADGALGQRIDAETAARTEAIGVAVGTETSARSAAIAGLDERKLDKSALVVLTESEYEALGENVDPDKYYFITEDEE